MDCTSRKEGGEGCMNRERDKCQRVLVLTSGEQAIQLLAIGDLRSGRRGPGGRAGQVTIHAGDGVQRLMTGDGRGGCGNDSGSGGDHLLSELLAAGLDRAVGLI